MTLARVSDALPPNAAPTRDSEAEFREMADTAPVMIWRSGSDNLCDWFNKPWLDFTGRTLAQEIGNGWAQGVHPDDLQRCLDVYLTSFAARQPFRMEYRLRRSDGEYRWLIDTGTPRHDRAGNFLGYFGSCIDVHDKIMAEQRHAQLLVDEKSLRAQADHVNEMKDHFLSVVSHELRTPLNAILGWAQILAEGNLSADDLREGLVVIQRNARMQTQIIDDILDMSRLVSGKVRLDVQRVDLPNVIDAAMDSMLPAAGAKEIRLQKVLDPIAGPVLGDPARLQQVVWNLLSNAIKFTPPRGRVRVTLERVNSHVEITVSDTGAGIKPDVLPFLFERLHQGDSSTTRRHGGLGLGLSIVKQLVELHGGGITVKSAGENEGATFRVSLPLTPLNNQQDPPDRQHPAARSERTDLGLVDLHGVSVLVVDDEADARHMLRRVLEDRGATVSLGGSVDEAMAVLEKTTPAVIISDIGMPDRDGYDFLRTLRARQTEVASIPAIALTAFARSEDRTLAMLAGFDVHVAKPVEPKELLAVVARLAKRVG